MARSGVGALDVRRGMKLDPCVCGSHENERRAGNGKRRCECRLGAQLQLATMQMEEEQGRLSESREIGDSTPSASRCARKVTPGSASGIRSTSARGGDEEGLVLGLDLEGWPVTAGQQCVVHWNRRMYSRRLACHMELARAAVRFSLQEQHCRGMRTYSLQALDQWWKTIRVLNRCESPAECSIEEAIAEK